LPSDIDTKIAERFAELLAKGTNGELLPSLSYSSSWEWEGSVSLRVETLASVLRDLKNSIEKLGGILVVVNAHGGNVGLLDAIGRQEGFYVINFYKACGLRPGHSGEVECMVAKALGIIEETCERGGKWPEGLVVKPKIELGIYDEMKLDFHEVVESIQRCAFKVVRELTEISKRQTIKDAREV